MGSECWGLEAGDWRWKVITCKGLGRVSVRFGELIGGRCDFSLVDYTGVLAAAPPLATSLNALMREMRRIVDCDCGSQLKEPSTVCVPEGERTAATEGLSSTC